ncbi:MAG: aminoacetone oxidase family FAD-binding enzyme [Oscillospiraceae bacterium]|nr:aminoacetone oxidase family FAD-binding enzyme [Oscillospiraceae bacterium]
MIYDTAIVGAGASGLAAAIAAGRAGGRVLLLERLPRAGKKILATGNGRCNLSNRAVLEHPYHNRDFALSALKSFGPAECEAFFRSLGLALREDAEGRVYPRSNTASSVLDALRFGAARAGVTLRCDTHVRSVRRERQGFLLNDDIRARRVILAAGGCAAPAHGSDGSGFALLAPLGHAIVPPKPALVQIRLKSPILPMLKGLRVSAGITLENAEGLPLREAFGEILFTEDGLSGIAAMELSRAAEPGTVAVLDLLPELSAPALAALLAEFARSCPEASPEQLLAGLLPKRIGEAVIKQSGSNKLDHFTKTAKRFAFPVAGTRGFAHAQITAGGAAVSEFCAGTLESRLVPGLYACGELLDIDGGCGGFMLHWAWASGLLAGQSLRQ